ncbi:MAG TPA: GAF domain-containing protein [Candidatus Acidoferrales bacterium]|nr:GAF domain-containing protein [Candidatus Acidoferrales bacterium]
MRDEQAMMDRIAGAIAAIPVTGQPRVARAGAAKIIAEAIRSEGGYRWVAVCKISESEVELIGWTGSETPAFVTFPATKGVTRDVIKTRAPIVVSDVRKDPRYLVAYSTTRSEVIVPVLGAGGAVIGSIEADSDRENAFSEADVRFIERCAEKVAALFADGKR